jgi:parvulin-like peptidyl-prolyl isomerase
MITSHLKTAKPGQTVPPFQVGSGWWVVKVLDVRPKTVLSFDQVQNAVRTNVLAQKITQEDKEGVVQELKTFEQHAEINVPSQDQEIVAQIKAPVAQPPVGAPIGPAPQPSAPAPRPGGATKP